MKKLILVVVSIVCFEGIVQAEQWLPGVRRDTGHFRELKDIQSGSKILFTEEFVFPAYVSTVRLPVAPEWRRNPCSISIAGYETTTSRIIPAGTVLYLKKPVTSVIADGPMMFSKGSITYGLTTTQPIVDTYPKRTRRKPKKESPKTSISLNCYPTSMIYELNNFREHLSTAGIELEISYASDLRVPLELPQK